jgi:hypothetical protein
MKECPECGLSFSPQGLRGHLRSHEPAPAKIPCEDCGKLFSPNGLGSHKWRTHGAGKGHQPTPKGTPAWNKGRTKISDSRVAANGRSISVIHKQRVTEGTYTPPPRSPKQREAQYRNLSLRMSRNNPGGRCKWYSVAGVKVQGTWERDLALKMCELGVSWQKRIKGAHCSWHYTDDKGKRRWYSPDFYLPALGIQIEVKGFWWGDDRRKMDLVLEQNPAARICIVENDLFQTLLKSDSKQHFLGQVA